MVRWMFMLGLFSCLGVILGAGAVDDTARKKAVEHYNEGEDHYRLGDFTKALAAYKKVLELIESPEMYYNIAQCHRQLKAPEKALFFYKRYLTLVPDTPLKDLVNRHIQSMTREVQRIQEVQTKPDETAPGKVIVMVHPPGSLVWVDRFMGRHVGTTPTVLELAPGPHVILVKKLGYANRRFEVQVTARGLHTVDARLEAESTEPPLPTPERPGKPGFSRWFWAGLTGTALLVTAAGITGTMAWQKNQDWRTSQEPDIKRDGMFYGDLATGFSMAALGVAGFTIWAAFWGRGGAPKRASEHTWFLVPGCEFQTCTLTFHLAF